MSSHERFIRALVENSIVNEYIEKIWKI